MKIIKSSMSKNFPSIAIKPRFILPRLVSVFSEGGAASASLTKLKQTLFLEPQIKNRNRRNNLSVVNGGKKRFEIFNEPKRKRTIVAWGKACATAAIS